MSRNVHYVLSAHWDREWYQTFQNYRYRLVKLIDHLIEGWQDGRLQGPFQADGQFILLDDYLEIRPERRQLVEQLVHEGKFILGPWYVLPDEFLVSGESLVRNLRMGREKTRALGVQPSNAGFLCDMFGHNSQMPQIFTGFGITGAFPWRGTNIIHNRRFNWKGADGTVLPSYRFGQIGYCSFANHVRGAHLGEIELSDADYSARLDGWLQDEASKTEAGPLLAFDGGDHLEWDQQFYPLLAQRFGHEVDGHTFMHTTLDAYLAEMLPSAGEITLTLEGELREPALNPDALDSQWLIPGVTSSRVNLKLANAVCQTKLCQWAEPLGAFAFATLGMEYPRGYLDVAWQWLIQNHPHDSICGCSIDAVHTDMLYRFSQCEQIAERISLEAGQQITASVSGDLGEDDLRVSVFNSLPVDLDEIVDLDLELPLEWPVFNEMSNRQAKYAFRVYAPDGQEVAYQRLGQQARVNRWRVFSTHYAQGYAVNIAKVSLPLHIPALGYVTLTVRPGEPGRPTRHPMLPGLETGERSMENDLLRVEIESDGTLTLTDKRSGEIYTRLLTFEDRADIGDGWNHGPAISDAAFYSNGCHSSISLVAQGRYKAAFRVRTLMDVPAAFDFEGMLRSAEIVQMVVDSTITLRAGADRVEVETVVHNCAKDHRLRVLFPSGAQAKTYLADTPFDVVERPIALREDNSVYREPEIEPKPQQSFCAVFDGQRGMAVASTGLLESGVIDQPARPLALTLLRATGQTVGTSGEPNGQMPGELRFNYWIAPFSAAPQLAYFARLGQLLAGGFRAVQQRRVDVRLNRQKTTLPALAGFMRLEGDVVLTSLRRTAAGLEARVYNPNQSVSQAVFDFTACPDAQAQPSTAQLVNLESQPLGPQESLKGGQAAFSLRPKQILTVCFA